MAIDDLIKDIKKHNIQEIIRVHEYNDRLTGDPRTDYGKGLEQKIDNITDYGKGIRYYSVDGKEWASYEEAMLYNEIFHERQMIHKEDKKGMHR